VPPVTSAHQPCGRQGGNPLTPNARVRRQRTCAALAWRDTLTPADGAQHCYDFLVNSVFLVRYRSPLACCSFPVVDVRLQIQREPCPFAFGEIDRSYRETAVDILR